MHTIKNAMIIKDSGLAVLVRAPSLKRDIWVPQSCVHEDSEIYRDGEVGTIGIKESWAEKEGLI